MNAENRQLNRQIEMERGDAALRQAKILRDNAEYDGAVSRAYYAIFHYAVAALLLRGIEPRSHEGLVRMFNLHFIKSGPLPKHFSRILSYAQKAREDADYYPEIPFTAEDAQQRITEAEEFIAAITALAAE